jgi:AraC family transcriptional regulator
MDYLRQIQRGLDYIEAHLDEDISPGDVARHAGISQWHFQRIFKALTTETLKMYIRSRRFSTALEMLERADVPVLQIALAAGFDTQESFTRAFKKAFGVTPGAYRRSRSVSRFARKARFDGDYLRHLRHNVSLQPELYEQRPLRLVGMVTRCFGTDSDKSNFAQAQPALWDAFMPRIGELQRATTSMAYGVVRVPQHGDELEYLAACEVPASAPVPPGMVVREVPAGRYARFAHQGPVARLDQTLNYVYSSWLLTSSMRRGGGCDLELYDQRFIPNSESSLMHYAIPVTDDGA